MWQPCIIYIYIYVCMYFCIYLSIYLYIYIEAIIRNPKKLGLFGYRQALLRRGCLVQGGGGGGGSFGLRRGV